jgi:hypothetical protein
MQIILLSINVVAKNYAIVGIADQSGAPNNIVVESSVPNGILNKLKTSLICNKSTNIHNQILRIKTY